MARYVFHLHVNGRKLSDDYGVELADEAEVRDEAAVILCKILEETVLVSPRVIITSEACDASGRLVLRSHAFISHES